MKQIFSDRCQSLQALDTKKLYQIWREYKTARSADEYLEEHHVHYLTVMERETILDIVIERLMYEKERHREGDDTADQ